MARSNVPRVSLNPAMKVVQERNELQQQLNAIGFRTIMLREVSVVTLLLLQRSRRLTPIVEQCLSTQIETFTLIISRCMGIPPEIEDKFRKDIDPKHLETEANRLADKLSPVIVFPNAAQTARVGGKFIL